MSDHGPRDADFDNLGLARLLLSDLAVHLANGATALVSTRNDADCGHGGRAGEADSLIAQAERLLAAAVVFERERGCSWEQLAHYLEIEPGEAERRFGPAMEAWRDALRRRAAGQPLRGLPQAVQHPGYVGSYLDRWAFNRITLTKDRHEVTGSLLGIPGPGEADDARLGVTDPLREMVREVIDGNSYMTLGTVGPDGLPRLSPVYFTHHGYRMFYWVSSPDAQHSQNVLRQPEITVVIFDSSLAPAATEAVYLTATAQQVPDSELADECDLAFRIVGGGARAFAPDELSGKASLRLFRATATSYEVHIRGSHPEFGKGIDTRMPVTMAS